MYAISSPEEYLSAGLSAVRCIDYVLARSAGHNNVRSILDFASGYGRVLRFLKARFPLADITSSDIDPTAVDFCRRAFSVNTIVSSLDFGGISMSNKFDLIWCGSLVTHIDENRAARLLRLFRDHLSPSWALHLYNSWKSSDGIYADLWIDRDGTTADALAVP